MKLAAQSREEYFALAVEREPDLRELDTVIQDAAPHLEPTFFQTDTMTMLGYGMVPYKTKAMKESSEWPLIALAVQKNHIALYICVIDPDGQYVAEKLQAQLGKVSCGKSCIRFKKLEDLKIDTVRVMLQDIDTRYVAGEKLFGQ